MHKLYKTLTKFIPMRNRTYRYSIKLCENWINSSFFLFKVFLLSAICNKKKLMKKSDKTKNFVDQQNKLPSGQQVLPK